MLTLDELKSKKQNGELVMRKCPGCQEVIENESLAMDVLCGYGCQTRFCFVCGEVPEGDVSAHIKETHSEFSH